MWVVKMCFIFSFFVMILSLMILLNSLCVPIFYCVLWIIRYRYIGPIQVWIYQSLGDREENVTLRRRTGLAFNPVNIHAMFSYRRETHTAVEEIGKAGDIVVTATEIYASR